MSLKFDLCSLDFAGVKSEIQRNVPNPSDVINLSVLFKVRKIRNSIHSSYVEAYDLLRVSCRRVMLVAYPRGTSGKYL